MDELDSAVLTFHPLSPIIFHGTHTLHWHSSPLFPVPLTGRFLIGCYYAIALDILSEKDHGPSV
jgi:hypothetical protein